MADGPPLPALSRDRRQRFGSSRALTTDAGVAELVAARVELLALRGRGRDVLPAWPILFPPRPHPFTEPEAARFMASLPKPVACEATIQGGVLVVRCRAATRTELEPHLSALDERLGRLRERHGDAVRVLVRGVAGEIVARWGDLITWTRDYRAPSVRARLSEPARGEHADGIVAVIELGDGADAGRVSSYG